MLIEMSLPRLMSVGPIWKKVGLPRIVLIQLYLFDTMYAPLYSNGGKSKQVIVDINTPTLNDTRPDA